MRRAYGSGDGQQIEGAMDITTAYSYLPVLVSVFPYHIQTVSNNLRKAFLCRNHLYVYYHGSFLHGIQTLFNGIQTLGVFPTLYPQGIMLFLSFYHAFQLLKI